MPQRTPPMRQGGVYHIYNRGIDHQCICRQPSDFSKLLNLIQSMAESNRINIHTWILLPNHFHFLVEQTANISIHIFMQKVFATYTRYFNRKYCRQGYLFESRYQAKEIVGETYYDAVTAYIRNNAIKHGLIASGEIWPFLSQKQIPEDYSNLPMRDDDDEFMRIIAAMPCPENAV